MPGESGRSPLANADHANVRTAQDDDLELGKAALKGERRNEAGAAAPKHDDTLDRPGGHGPSLGAGWAARKSNLKMTPCAMKTE